MNIKAELEKVKNTASWDSTKGVCVDFDKVEQIAQLYANELMDKWQTEAAEALRAHFTSTDGKQYAETAIAHIKATRPKL